MIFHSQEEARSARLLVFISWHFKRDRIQYLFEQIRCFAEFVVTSIEVVLCTNTNDLNEHQETLRALKPLKSTGLLIRFEVFPDLPDPWLLPWQHKPLLKKALREYPEKYTHFIYAEDDIRFTYHNFLYFLEYRERLSQHQLIPSFLRYEFNRKQNAAFLTDIVDRSELKREGVILDGQIFVSPGNPYCAMYILDLELADEYVQSSSFDELSSRDVIAWPTADRSAMGMSFERPPAGYRSRCVVPINLITQTPSYGSLVHHLPNNYTDREWTENDKFHFGHTEIDNAFYFKDD